jgi:hypothetical protein
MNHRVHVVAVTLVATLAACQDTSRQRFDGATIRLATGALSATATGTMTGR